MRWRGAASIIWLLLSWAALDDITTDNASGAFVPEYTLLVLAGIWFAGVGVWLIAKRCGFAGVFSLLAVALGTVAFWSLPHHFEPPSLVNYLGYVPLAWFAGMTAWLLAARGPSGRKAITT